MTSQLISTARNTPGKVSPAEPGRIGVELYQRWEPGHRAASLLLLSAGVALLPFVDEQRLRAALDDVYPDLTPEEGEE